MTTRELQKIIHQLEIQLKKFPELTYAGNPVLRTKSKKVTTKEGVVIAKKLTKILLRYRNLMGTGRGIAAPQIEIGKAVFVTLTDGLFQTFINPRMIAQSNSYNYLRESCISSREFCCDVKRPERTTLAWTDEHGKRHTGSFDGLMARLIQHEYDHLQGVLNIDRAEQKSITYCPENVVEEQLRKAPYFQSKK